LANLTFTQIFGNSYNAGYVPENDEMEAFFSLSSFKSVDDGGELENGLGISDFNTNRSNYERNGNKGINIFYALMLMIMQNQAEGKNDDPEQKIYIAPGGVSVVSFGNRTGQLERRFTVSIYSDGEYGNTADVDSI